MTVLKDSLARFLRDERGSYTVWSLVWFILYCGIGGLAVDITDAYRHQSLLQATADSAALAAVMSLGVPDEDPVDQATTYAADNMSPNSNGIVLTPADVTIGTWDFATETFFDGGPSPNAVHVVTRRSDDNNNPVGMNFLRILGLFGFDPFWNVVADAVAVKGVNKCHNNGIIARGELRMTTHQGFWNNICLIGGKGFKLTNHNYFETGVYAGVGCSKTDSKCLMPNAKQALSDQDFSVAFGAGPNGTGAGNYKDPTQPVNANNVGNHVTALLNMHKYTLEDFKTTYSTTSTAYTTWDFLSPDGKMGPAFVEGSSLPAKALTPEGQYTIYKVNCKSNFKLPEGTYANIAIVTTCPIHVNSGNFTISNTIIAADGNWSTHGIHFSGKVDVGDPGNCGKPGLLMMTNGSGMHFASGADVNNVVMLSAKDVKFAAKGNGHSGIHIEARGNVDLTSQGNFGICDNDFKNQPVVYSFALVR